MRIEVAERRARIGRRHRLAADARADDPVEVARELVALHASDPPTVYLALFARLAGADIGVRTVDRALYDDRTLIRMLAMRRTMFVTPLEFVSVLHEAAARTVAGRERRKLLGFLAEAGVADDVERWLAEVEAVALRAIEARGEVTSAELAEEDERLRQPLVLARGKSYEGRQRVVARLLLLLAAEGRIVRGRPRSTWRYSPYRWSLAQRWYRVAPEPWTAEEAEVELARRWLAAYGPAPAEDLRWWAGWTVGQTRRALAGVKPVEVDLDGGTGLLLPGDLEPVPPVEPWAALLPGLDPTPMGWSRREWFLGGHGPRLFDRFGNIGPTVWWDGRIVGGWAQRKDGEIAYRLLEEVGAEAVGAVEAAVAELTGRLGEARITPQFRTPLERELSG
ncbi:winged helix DNA-binding domain-containing protein [Micromonosporaceae bacterium B7E4]